MMHRLSSEWCLKHDSVNVPATGTDRHEALPVIIGHTKQSGVGCFRMRSVQNVVQRSKPFTELDVIFWHQIRLTMKDQKAVLVREFARLLPGFPKLPSH